MKLSIMRKLLILNLIISVAFVFFGKSFILMACSFLIMATIIALFTYSNFKRKETVWENHKKSQIKKQFEETRVLNKMTPKGRVNPNALVIATKKFPKVEKE
ncbi:hypothetical protein [Lactococcus lactis]|uniref:hypothetical protein n=1 Tax=Lactococcus lactis TaxID=1358 RepID=UPI001913141A|nr:hypothetical protein [Lactococcus lactis]WDA67609.1 hypothetical protein IL310_01740 [Lactococcus lactis]